MQLQRGVADAGLVQPGDSAGLAASPSFNGRRIRPIADGGQDYPEKMLREPKRNIRVWLQDGANDMENARYGSWPLANIRMANALKAKEYDFHFSFGKGTHNSGAGGGGVSRGDDLAVAGLRCGEDGAGVHCGPGGEGQAVFPVAALNRGSE